MTQITSNGRISELETFILFAECARDEKLIFGLPYR